MSGATIFSHGGGVNVLRFFVGAFFVLCLFHLSFYEEIFPIAHAQTTDAKFEQSNFEIIGGCDTNIVCYFKSIFILPAMAFQVGIAIAVSIFSVALSPEIYNSLYNLPALYIGWGVIRDLFNLLFIFALLFSAFATIFQIQKYHLKNYLVKILILALLINFSWPIARIIIDASHMLMFFFVGGSTGSQIAAIIADTINIDKILFLGTEEEAYSTALSNTPILTLLLVDVFMLIFMITLFNIAFQMVIRIGALMVLLMLSPVGLAGAAIPQLQSASNRWWSAFVQYAFRGPILVFMILFASQILISMVNSQVVQNTFEYTAGSNAGAIGTEGLATMVAFSVPIAILWVALAASKSVGDASGAMVMDLARKVGRKGSSITLRSTGRAARATGRVADNVTRGYFGSRWAGRAAGVRAGFNRWSEQSIGKRAARRDESKAKMQQVMGDKNAIANLESRQRAELKKKAKEENWSQDEINSRIANPGTSDNDRKALRELQAEGKEVISSAKGFKKAMEGMGDDFENLEKLINGAAKDNALKSMTEDDYHAIRKDIGSRNYLSEEDVRDVATDFDLKPGSSEHKEKVATVLKERQVAAVKALDKRVVKAGKVDLKFEAIRREEFEKTKSNDLAIQSAARRSFESLKAKDFADQSDMHKLMESNDQIAREVKEHTLDNAQYLSEFVKHANMESRRRLNAMI